MHARVVFFCQSYDVAQKDDGRKYNNWTNAAYHTIQYNTITQNAIPYNTTQYNTIQYNAMQCNAMQRNAIQYNTIHFISKNNSECYNRCS